MIATERYVESAGFPAYLAETGRECVPDVQAQRCPCGLYLLGDPCPYCGVGLTQRRNVERVQPTETLADFDAKIAERMAVGKAEREAWQANVGGGIEGGVESPVKPDTSGHSGDRAAMRGREKAPSDLDPQPRPARKRRPRRTKKEMQAARAQAKREAKYADWHTTLGTALEGQTEAEDEFLAAIRKEDET